MKDSSENINLAKLRRIFASYPQVKLAYLFGSTARKDRGPISDYDFAIFLDNKDVQEATRIRFELMEKISFALADNSIDVVILDLTGSPELKYNILQEGKLIFEREPFRVIFEPLALNEYFDFYSLLKKHALTRA